MPHQNDEPPMLEGPELQELLAFMRKRNLARIEFTIDAVQPTPARLAVAEREMSLTDDSAPSDLGLEGVYIVVSS
jgi:hypothetical protein